MARSDARALEGSAPVFILLVASCRKSRWYCFCGMICDNLPIRRQAEFEGLEISQRYLKVRRLIGSDEGFGIYMM